MANQIHVAGKSIATTTLTALLMLLTLQLLARQASSLRTGAPAIACVNLRPFHGLNRPKPASASQFFLTQSSLSYGPNQNVTVDISTHSDQRYFRGFIVQAYDPITGHQVGHFLQGSETRPIDSCSAATHRSNSNKKHVSITWLPPPALGLPTRPPVSSVDMLAAPWMSLMNPPTSRKRQVEASTSAPIAPNIVGVPQAGNQAPQGNSPAAASQPTGQQQQVRFRASIVVTYDEFYTGFESTDQSFDKFDYANGMPRSPTAPVAA